MSEPVIERIFETHCRDCYTRISITVASVDPDPEIDIAFHFALDPNPTGPAAREGSGQDADGDEAVGG